MRIQINSLHYVQCTIIRDRYPGVRCSQCGKCVTYNALLYVIRTQESDALSAENERLHCSVVAEKNEWQVAHVYQTELLQGNRISWRYLHHQLKFAKYTTWDTYQGKLPPASFHMDGGSHVQVGFLTLWG